MRKLINFSLKKNFNKYFKSLKLRLSLLFSGIIITLLSIIFSYLYYFLHTNINEESQRIVDERVLLISDILNEGSEGLATLKQRIEKDWISAQHEPLWIRVEFPNKEIFSESPQFSLMPHENFYISERNLSVKIDKNKELKIKLFLKLDRSKEEELLYSYAEKVIILLFITLFVSIYLTYFVISMEIKPLLIMSRKMKSITTRSLHRRINYKKFPRELIPVAESFNFMLNELENSFEQISRFSSDIAHELRTPLNSLMIKIDVMLEKTRTVSEYQELLESLHTDTRNLSKLITTLLFLTKVENPNLELQREIISVDAEIRKLIDLYEPLASEKKISILAVAPSDLILNVEKNLFSRALGNLLQNAIQYSPEKSNINILAKMQTNGTHSEVLISVIDEGVGISSEHLPFILNRLYRVDSSRSSQPGNLGLGLSIVSSIMKLHGGRVSIDSEVGKGSRFHLYFPT